MFPFFPTSGLQTHTVDVYRPAFAHDAAGGSKQTFNPVVGQLGLPASIQPLAGAAQRLLGERQVIVTHHVYLFNKPAIRKGDLIANTDTGEKFLVHGIEDMAGRGQVWQVECKLIT